MSQLEAVTPGISIVTEQSFSLLGAPIFEPAFAMSFREKQKTLQRFLERIKEITPHVGLFLLQHCLWIPRLNYLLRCIPMFKFDNLLTEMDSKIKQTLKEMLNLKFTEQTWTQCSLPIKLGGIGIR